MSSLPEVVLNRFQPAENFFITGEKTLKNQAAKAVIKYQVNFKNIDLDDFSNILSSASNIEEWVIIVEKGKREIIKYDQKLVIKIIEQDIRNRFTRIGENPPIFDIQLYNYLLNYVFKNAVSNFSEKDKNELISIMVKKHATALKRIDTTFNRGLINCRLTLSRLVNSVALKVIVGIAVFGLLSYFGLSYGLGLGIRIITYCIEMLVSTLISKIGLIAFGAILSFSLVSYALRNKYPRMYNITRTIFINIGAFFRFLLIMPIVLPLSVIIMFSGLLTLGVVATHHYSANSSVDFSERAKQNFMKIQIDQARQIFVNVVREDNTISNLVNNIRERIFQRRQANHPVEA